MTTPRATFDGRVPPPDFVNIETTKFCNLRCDMCHQFQDGTVVTGPHLEWESFERWARATLPFATRFQPSVTGEPLMSKGLPRLLALAADYGVRLDIVTNATLLNARMRALLLPVLGKITVSFDAASKAVFETVRAGSEFETVVANVRAVATEVGALAPERRPLVVLACVLSRRNIDELPALVDLAVDLGVHWLALSHMFPPTEQLKRESLVHDVERACRRLDEAFSKAEAVGLPLTAQPLDQLIAASALRSGGRRHFAVVDGAVDGLGARSVHTDRIPNWPTALAGADDTAAAHERVEHRRSTARAAAEFAAFDAPRVGRPQLPESIWVCDFLWNKTYVTLTGDVRTCCVPGTPVIGNIERQPFATIWDDPVYAAMRTRIARQDPAPVCRGCQHIVELRDPAEIERWLGGRALPADDAFAELPVVLDPAKLAGIETDAASTSPVLSWEPLRNARGYEVELSLDEFKTVAYATSWHGPLLDAARFAVPAWVWSQAPVGEPVYWRAVAWLPESKLEAALGCVMRQASAGD